jgi:deoxyadenosine/deoxycytidine kinase
MKLLFSIEGNIGSGKSTLIESLKKIKTNFIFLPEPVDLWNEIVDSNGTTILENYYKEPKQYAFSFQMMAYITRLQQVKDCVKNSPPDCVIITERCLYTDREVFAKMLYDSGNISQIEYSIYLKWFDSFIEKDVLTGIIYMKSDPELCSKRICHRNRKGEESIPLEYLTNCHNYHETWLTSLINKGLPIMLMNDSMDIVNISSFINTFR